MRIETVGEKELLAALKGVATKEVNQQLRAEAQQIAARLLPELQAAILASAAPQAPFVAASGRVVKDRVPVVAFGSRAVYRTGGKRFKRAKDSAKGAKLRQGSIAHGVVYGALGGKRSTRTDEDYYAIPRDNSGGAVGERVNAATMIQTASDEYKAAFLKVMHANGLEVK